MIIGSGTGWVQRWFAKLLVKGSIPSRASKYRWGRKLGACIYRRGRALQSPFWSGAYQKLHNEFGCQDRHKSPSYARLEKIMLDHHKARVKAETKLAKLNEEFKAKSIELSRLKRLKTPPNKNPGQMNDRG